MLTTIPNTIFEEEFTAAVTQFMDCSKHLLLKKKQFASRNECSFHLRFYSSVLCFLKKSISEAKIVADNGPKHILWSTVQFTRELYLEYRNVGHSPIPSEYASYGRVFLSFFWGKVLVATEVIPMRGKKEVKRS
jgi:hypothetical protein